jgi:hypothetical protein
VGTLRWRRWGSASGGGCDLSALNSKKVRKKRESPFLRAGLPVFPRSPRLCYKIPPGKTLHLRLEPTSTGDKRDDISAYSLVLAIVPFVIRRPPAPVGLGCPVVGCFPSCQNCSIKRTPERTLLTRWILLSGGGALTGRSNAADRHYPSLSLSLYRLLHRIIMLASADVSPVVAADARAERTGARPSRAVVVRRPRRLNLTHTVVRFLDGIKRVRGFLW